MDKSNICLKDMRFNSLKEKSLIENNIIKIVNMEKRKLYLILEGERVYAKFITLPRINNKNKINEIIKKDSQKRSEFFREAIILYIEERKKQIKLDEMKKGYIEMANINRDYAEQGFEQDVKDLKNYEAMLSESDFPNDTTDSKKRRYILC